MREFLLCLRHRCARIRLWRKWNQFQFWQVFFAAGWKPFTSSWKPFVPQLDHVQHPRSRRQPKKGTQRRSGSFFVLHTLEAVRTEHSHYRWNWWSLRTGMDRFVHHKLAQAESSSYRSKIKPILQIAGQRGGSQRSIQKDRPVQPPHARSHL